ncbi:MAG: ABC transporter permease [Elusimicrobiaceae bacterium]|nr:ABC transporter permease [Elusimicrobiaceae bacterium]
MTDSFSPRRAASIAKKEIKHLLRDPFTLALAALLPVILVVFFGFVIDFNYRDISVAVMDFDRTPASRQLKRYFTSSGYFRITELSEHEDPVYWLDNDRAYCALVINPRFGKAIAAGRPARAQLLLDGTDNSKTGVVASYAAGLAAAAQAGFYGGAPAGPVELHTRFLFNPELDTSWFVVPGLAVLIIGLLCTLLTALTVAREWENGSMELLLSTPVHPAEIVAGKLAPYVVLALGATAFVYLFARLAFHIPFAGSGLVYSFAAFVFVVAMLGQGLLISIVTRQQQLAMQASIVLGLLPPMMLSGFIFPVESMPVFFRYLTGILPARWFMEISRSQYLRGTAAADLLVPLGMLCLLALFLVVRSGLSFKTDLEQDAE